MTQFELSKHITRNVNEMKSTTKMLLLALVDFSGPNNNWTCWPSAKTLSAMVGVTPRKIGDHLNILRELGYVTTEQRYDNSLVYTIQVATLTTKTTVGQDETSSRVTTKQAVATVENVHLTNQEQSNEHTTEQNIFKEDAEVESNEVDDTPLTLTSTVSSLPSVSSLNVVAEKYAIDPEKEKAFLERVKRERELAAYVKEHGAPF